MSVKATLLKRGATAEQSFSIGEHKFRHFLKVWHYHPELELVYITKSQGTCFIGDNIDRFEDEELFLIGSNLPHMYQNDEAYFAKNSKLKAEAIAIHFNSNFLNTNLESIPEFGEINAMIVRSKLGLRFSSRAKDEVGHLIREIITLSGLERMITFIKVLGILSQQADIKTIASPGFINHFNETDDSRLDEIYDFVLNNFQEDLGLDQVAELVSMNKSSFCRYFKRTTQKSFTEFLNEVRIGYACKMLMEKQMGILEISYYCGYNNVTDCC